MGAERVSLMVYRVHGKDSQQGESFDFRLEAGRDSFDRIDWPVNEAFEIVPKRADPTPELVAALKEARAAIETLDVDALGVATCTYGGAPYQYPIRDELLDKLNRAIAKAAGGG